MSAIPRWLRPIGRRARRVARWARRRFHLVDSSTRLEDDAQTYWTGRLGDGVPEAYFHMRGHDMFADDRVWWELGAAHFALFEQFARMLDFPRPMTRVLEWGCGGGANAVHFGSDADEFIGVDVSQDALDECGRQMAAESVGGFVPALVGVGDHSDVVQRFMGSCDLFLCTYVFEVLPTPQHGAELLAAARDLLRPGGMALVQMKYATTDPNTHSRPWNYSKEVTFVTTYPIDEFWTLAESVGLTPRAIVLRPAAPEVHDERYAYYALVKPV